MRDIKAEGYLRQTSWGQWPLCFPEELVSEWVGQQGKEMPLYSAWQKHLTTCHRLLVQVFKQAVRKVAPAERSPKKCKEVSLWRNENKGNWSFTERQGFTPPSFLIHKRATIWARRSRGVCFTASFLQLQLWQNGVNKCGRLREGTYLRLASGQINVGLGWTKHVRKCLKKKAPEQHKGCEKETSVP